MKNIVRERAAYSNIDQPCHLGADLLRSQMSYVEDTENNPFEAPVMTESDMEEISNDFLLIDNNNLLDA